MKRQTVAGLLSIVLAACSGGGETVSVEEASKFSDPAMRQAVQYLSQGSYGPAVDAARGSTGIDTVGEGDVTLLLLAVNANDAAGVRALLAAGANPSIPQGRAPIAAAAERADPQIVFDLLKAGADPNGRSGSEPAIWRAAVRNSAPIVDALLQHGAAIDAANSLGETPVLAATQATKYQMAVHLLQRGASPLAKSEDGTTIAEWAAEANVHPDTDEGRAREQLYALLRQAGAMP